MLLFYVSESRYAIDNQYILRVVPYALLKSMPYADSYPYIAGLLNLGGKLIPVIDFCQLIEKRKATFSFHTRIILIKDIRAKSGSSIAGLIGEKITEIVDLDRSQFSEVEFYSQRLSYLDGVYSDNKGVIQRVRIEEFFEFLGEKLSSKME